MQKRVSLWIIILFIFPLLSLANSKNNDIQKLEEQLDQTKGKGRIEILNQLATRLFVKEPEITIKYTNEAINLSERFNDPHGKANALFYLGRAHFSLDHLREFFRYINQSLKIFKILEDEEMIWLVTKSLGYYYITIGSFTEALRYNRESLTLAEEMGDDDKISESYYQSGRIYTNLKNFNKAMEHYQQALKFSKNTVNRMRALNNIGITLESLGQYKKALTFYQKNLRLARETNNTGWITSSMSNIGDVYGRLEIYDKAISYLLKAHKNYTNLGNKRGIFITLRNIGDLYMEKGDYERSKLYYFQAFNMVEKTERINLKIEIYQRISNLFSKLGKYKEALDYHKRYTDMKDIKINKQKNQQFLELQERYEAENKEKSINILRRDNRIKQLTLYFILAGFLVVLILFTLLFKKYRYLFSFWKKQKYIGQYRIVETIGEGGMGNVFKAHHIKDKTSMVAIKVLKDTLFRVESNRKRFKQEGVIIDQLNHPNILKTYERGEYEDKMYIVMEYINGKTLESKIEEDEQMDLKTCFHIMIQITDALALIHSKCIVHRDLKPANILLTEHNGDKNFVKLLDFGLSKMKFQTRVTQSGVLVGTVNYIAPEQIMDSEYSFASDIYSLGVVFYEMIAGKTAFSGDSMPSIVEQIMNKPLENLQSYRPEVPDTLNHLITQMTSKDSKQRPSVRSVLETLKAVFKLY